MAETKNKRERETPELGAAAKADLLEAIERSLHGWPISDQQAILLFYWTRHQDDEAFDFVPKKYKLNANARKKAARRKNHGKGL